MKKIILLLAAGVVALGANARYVHRNTAAKLDDSKAVKQKMALGEGPAAFVTHKGPQAKGTAAALDEHFDTGMPAGWTAVGVTPNTTSSWKWYPNGQLSTAPYHIGAIASTTGFMIYDSDSIGGGGTGPIVPVGYLQTAAINCTGKSSIGLTFDEYYRRFQDSCFVEVSTSPTFATSTKYPVSVNNALSSNDYVSTNPYNVFMNISAVAANQAAVYLRFWYYGPPGGGYSWQIDNVKMDVLPPVSVGIHSSFLFVDSTFEAPYQSSIGNVPSRFRPTFAPITFVDNLGANAQSGFSITAKIYKNGVLTAYNNSVTVPALPQSAQDSSYQFPDYTPDAFPAGPDSDVYFCAYGLNVTGNANTTMLTDTVRFSVTDSTWDQNIGAAIGSFYVHRPANNPPELSLYIGTRFDVQLPPVGNDSITSVAVAFQSTTTPGSTVQVQIYKLDQTPANGWLTKYATYTHTLTAADISTASAVAWCYFPIDASSGHADMTPGTYAAVVSPSNVPANNTVLVLDTKPNPASPYAGFFGQEDSSNNDGGFNFGFGTQATGIAAIPMVQLHFGKQVQVGVNEVAKSLKLEDIYPNPANSEVNVPFTLTQDEPVNVTITNMKGQVVGAQGMGMVKAGQRTVATFSTSGLASGVYFYTVDVNGKYTSNRFVVTH